MAKKSCKICFGTGRVLGARGYEKPIMTFGLTNSGDPKHPLTLGYDTPLVPYN